MTDQYHSRFRTVCISQTVGDLIVYGSDFQKLYKSISPRATKTMDMDLCYIDVGDSGNSVTNITVTVCHRQLFGSSDPGDFTMLVTVSRCWQQNHPISVIYISKLSPTQIVSNIVSQLVNRPWTRHLERLKTVIPRELG